MAGNSITAEYKRNVYCKFVLQYGVIFQYMSLYVTFATLNHSITLCILFLTNFFISGNWLHLKIFISHFCGFILALQHFLIYDYLILYSEVASIQCFFGLFWLCSCYFPTVCVFIQLIWSRCFGNTETSTLKQLRGSKRINIVIRAQTSCKF